MFQDNRASFCKLHCRIHARFEKGTNLVHICKKRSQASVLVWTTCSCTYWEQLKQRDNVPMKATPFAFSLHNSSSSESSNRFQERFGVTPKPINRLHMDGRDRSKRGADCFWSARNQIIEPIPSKRQASTRTSIGWHVKRDSLAAMSFSYVVRF